MVLAAGAGSRFEAGPDAAHKLLAPIDGDTVVGRAVAHAVAAGLAATWVVTGAADLAGRLPREVRVIHNPSWGSGQASSLQRAVEAARRDGVDELVVGLGDQPFVTPEAWRRVAASPGPIAVATYAGRRGHPVKLAKEVWDLLPVSGDAGARQIMAERPELVQQVPCEGDPVDIDTREDLSRWS